MVAIKNNKYFLRIREIKLYKNSIFILISIKIFVGQQN